MGNSSLNDKEFIRVQKRIEKYRSERDEYDKLYHYRSELRNKMAVLCRQNKSQCEKHCFLIRKYLFEKGKISFNKALREHNVIDNKLQQITLKMTTDIELAITAMEKCHLKNRFKNDLETLKSERDAFKSSHQE